MFQTTREQRRQLERENAKRPVTLQLVPPEEWPTRAVPPGLLRVWRSREFLVQEMAGDAPVLVRLSVNRTTRSGDRWLAGISWEDLQRIKNECGYGAFDAVEVYPAVGDEVNVSNMRHLWVMREKLPFTWRDKART